MKQVNLIDGRVCKDHKSRLLWNQRNTQEESKLDSHLKWGL